MQTVTEKLLRLAPPGGLFDETVLCNLFPKASVGARRLLVHRAISFGEILRLKRGLFILAAEYRKSEAHPFSIASLLHGPSHISLESALAHHGLIPEAVYQVASVTAARSRVFKTPLGVFTFRRVPAHDPLAGVAAGKLGNGAWVFIASPLRAIADMVYLNRNVTWNRDGLNYLTASLRIEAEDLARISFRPLDAICRSIQHRRTREYLVELQKAVKHGR